MTNRKHLELTTSMLLFAVLTGCGSGGGRTKSSDAAPATPESPGPITTSGTPGAGPSFGPDAIGATSTAALTSLRVLGTNNPGYSAVLLGVKLLQVSVDGAPVAVDFSGVEPTFDLANGTHAWLAGRFPTPAPGSQIAVALTFDDAGGYSDATGSGTIAAWALPVRFTAPAEWLAQRGHAVVHLDLARSLLPGSADEKVLLPNLQVRF